MSSYSFGAGTDIRILGWPASAAADKLYPVVARKFGDIFASQMEYFQLIDGELAAAS